MSSFNRDFAACDCHQGPFYYYSKDYAALPRHLQLLRERVADFGTREALRKVHRLNLGHAVGAPSQRLLDWLCVNFAKSKLLTLTATDLTGSARFVRLHVEYKTWLSTWKRKLFDPFQRGPRLFYIAPDAGAVATTTVGQLNFVKFMRATGVLEFLAVLDNRRQVEGNMAATLRAARERKKRSSDAKRRCLSAEPSQQCVVVNMPSAFRFECDECDDDEQGDEQGAVGGGATE